MHMRLVGAVAYGNPYWVSQLLCSRRESSVPGHPCTRWQRLFPACLVCASPRVLHTSSTHLCTPEPTESAPPAALPPVTTPPPKGFCIRGDVCPYAHGVFECWLHPSRYRTQLCKDGANCHRPVCFFAHSLNELRAPTYTWVPTPADVARTPTVGPNGTANAPAAAGGGGEAADGDVVSGGGGGGLRGQSVPQSASAGQLSARSGTGVVCSPQSSATEAMVGEGPAAWRMGG